MKLMETLGRALPRLAGRERAGRTSRPPAEVWEQGLGLPPSWAPATYGEYYPRSALVYSAIRVRQDAIVRAPLRVYRRGGAGEPASRERAALPVGPDHPAQRLLDRPNPFWTRGELWRATETSLGLWGAAFWGLERRDGEVVEIWPLRSDRMRVVPDEQAYVKGFVYVGAGHTLVPYVAEDVVWIRYFNPLDELAGLSPMAPLRLSADMGIEALRANRNNLSNDSTPGMIIETMDTPTDYELKEFYERWEARYQGVDRVRRPALLGSGMRATNLGFSPKDMEYIQSLQCWSLEDVCRVFGVPKAMLGDTERITFSNFRTARRVFWEDTILPQLSFYQEALQQWLLPNFGDPSLVAEFDLSEIDALRESENDRAERRRKYVGSGIMTVNEVREEMNLAPVSWGNGPS